MVSNELLGGEWHRKRSANPIFPEPVGSCIMVSEVQPDASTIL